MVKIIVLKGASIVELTDGGRIPQMRPVAYDIPVRGIKHTDIETGDVVWEFAFQGRRWTVDAAYVKEV